MVKYLALEANSNSMAWVRIPEIFKKGVLKLFFKALYLNVELPIIPVEQLFNFIPLCIALLLALYRAMESANMRSLCVFWLVLRYSQKIRFTLPNN